MHQHPQNITFSFFFFLNCFVSMQINDISLYKYFDLIRIPIAKEKEIRIKFFFNRIFLNYNI